MSDAAEFLLTANGYAVSPNADVEAYNDGPTRTLNTIRKRLIGGVLDDQLDTVWAEDTDDTGTTDLAASGTRSVDLQTETDARGNAITLTDVVMLLITHKAASSSSSISVEANAANGWTNFLATTANLTLPPGATLVLFAPVADSVVVGASNKVLDLVNDDGANAAQYRIEVWGRTG